MPDLSQATYEELSREVEHRLNQGLFDFLGLYSTNQQNYRTMWDEACDEVNAKCLEDFDRWQPLRQIMLDAMDRHQGERVQMHRKVYGVNTTHYGDVAEKDHRPE